VIDDLLRKRLGFDRVVISDDLEMSAIADHFGIEQAVKLGAVAGVDLFLVCHQIRLQHQAIDALIEVVVSGAIPRERIIQANRRLDRLFDRFVRPPVRWNNDAASTIGCAEHRKMVDLRPARSTPLAGRG
jgi:beta-N-acetylhexosaminidase